MASSSETVHPTDRISARSLVRSGVLALVASLVVNWLITFVAIAADVAPELDPLNYGPVTFFTALGVVGAVVTYAALTRFVENPDRVFVGVAAVVLLVSLVPDFTVIPDRPGGNLQAGAVLGLLHVTTAVICVVLLTDLDDRFV